MSANISELMKTGKYEQDQAVAIAEQNCRDSKAVKHVFAAPKPAGVFSRVKNGLTIYKDTATGLRYLFIVTSNSYKDRDNETIATKALEEYVAAAWSVEGKCLPENPLLFWHDGPPIGDVVWTDTEGPFLLEVAKERPNRGITLRGTSKAFRTTIKSVWDALETAVKRWGASHGFKYTDDALDNGVYKHIRKFETSVLPLDAAANPYTFAGVIDDMNKDKVLEDLLKTPGVADKFRKGIRAVKGELDKRGLEHKAKDEQATKGKLEDAVAVLDAAFAKIGENVPEGFSAQILQQLIGAMSDSGGGAEPDGDEPAAEHEEYMADEPATEEDTNQPVATNAKNVAFFDRLIKSQETLAQQAIEQMDANKQLADEFKSVKAEVEKVGVTVKDVPQTVKSLTDRLDAIEKRLSGAPRRASADAATIVKDDDLTQHAKQALEKVEELFPGSGIKIKSGTVPSPDNGKKG